MKVILAKHAGYCYGVERALKLAREASLNSEKPIVTLGPIIHNPQVVDWLKSLGIHPADEIKKEDKGTVIVRSHGIDPNVAKKFEQWGLEIIDATCPFVKKAQSCAKNLINEGYEVLIVGERNHPEVIGILAYTDQAAIIIENAGDAKKLSKHKKLGIVVQTTQSEDNLKKIISELGPKADEIRIFNTICDATTKSQSSAKELARDADVILIVGGKNSANTRRLAQICSEINPKSFHIETAAEIEGKMFKNAKIVGVTAGASTADWIIEEVINTVKDIKA